MRGEVAREGLLYFRTNTLGNSRVERHRATKVQGSWIYSIEPDGSISLEEVLTPWDEWDEAK